MAAKVTPKCCDLLIIGAGPAGLAAAINGASEGLKVRLLDKGPLLGGQAVQSSAIENYPGFPKGITGRELMGRFVDQAHKFRTSITVPGEVGFIASGADGVEATTTDMDNYQAKAALLSFGLAYRQLDVPGLSRFIGRGVHYGVPGVSPTGTKKRTLVLVGGANSAGQAALNLARNTNCRIVLMVRGDICDKMSTYLVDRITDAKNIEAMNGCQITSCHGDETLREVTYQSEGQEHRLECHGLYLFIGAVPHTLWLRDKLDLDGRGYVETEGKLPFETSAPGVFAAGDVRSGSTKRIATAIGEGVTALQMIHQYLSANRRPMA